MPLRRHRRRPDQLVEDVCALLAAEFDWDDVTVAAFRASFAPHAHAGRLPGGYEFICDSPTAANWRLKPDSARGGLALRLGCHRLHPSGPDPRAERVNAALAALPSRRSRGVSHIRARPR